MIKGKPSYPFETIALAVDFTPLLESLIAEVKHLAEAFGAKTIFIYPGKHIAEKERKLSELLLRYNFPEATAKIISQGGYTIDSVLSICKDETVDLLIVSNSEKKEHSNYFPKNFAREVSLKAKCSVLLIKEPNALSYRQIVVNGHEHPKTMHTIETAIYFATKEKAGEITIADGVFIPQLSLSFAGEDDFAATEPDLNSEIIKDEISRITRDLKGVDRNGLKINVKAFSTRQLNFSQFARQINADLLVVNSSDHHLSIFDRIPANDVEELVTDLPCNTLIVHSRVY